MQNTLYIPKTITVGYQSRDDTFTKKLGYIIYTDHTGKLRKETSWNGWRSKELGEHTYDNEPTLGFNFNKGVKRDGHWGSGRSVIRVWDPRDFEFEISIDNLIGILMHADVSKRDITEKCVFAWKGTELILLPVNSVEYQESMKYTEKQAKKVNTKELVPGYMYGVKKDPLSVVYLGYFEQFDAVSTRTSEETYYGVPERFRSQVRKNKKHHVFMDPTTKEVLVKNPATYLATVDVEEVHAEFAAMLDIYFATYESQPISHMAIVQATVDVVKYAPHYHYINFRPKHWIDVGDNVFAQLTFSESHHNSTKLPSFERFVRFLPETKQLEFSYAESRSSYYRSVQYPANKVAVYEHHRAKIESAIEVMKQFADRYRQATTRSNNSPIGIKEQATTLQELEADLFTHGIGQLTYILADGKASTTQLI